MGDDQFYQFYTPAYRWLLARFWQVMGTFEKGLVALTPLVLTIFVIGMFLLLYHVCRNVWLALSLTTAAASYQLSMGQEIWGVAGSSHLLARTLFTAVMPYLVLLLFSSLKKPTLAKGIILGLAAGLATNLHPTSGLHMVMLLGAMLFFVSWSATKAQPRPAAKGESASFVASAWRLRGRYWLTMAGLVLGVIIGAWPVATNFASNTERSSPTGFTFEAFNRVLSLYYEIPFDPAEVEWPLLGLTLSRPVLDGLIWLYCGLTVLFLIGYFWGRHHWSGLVRWGWLICGLFVVWYAYLLTLFNLTLFFGLIAFYVIYRFKQNTITTLDWWLMGLSGLIIFGAFVGYYFLTLAWQRYELWSFTALFTQQLRMARFIYLPVYLLTALAGQALIEVMGKWLTKRDNTVDLSHVSPASFMLSAPIALLLLLIPPKFSHSVGNDLWDFVVLLLCLGVTALMILHLQEAGVRFWHRWLIPVSIIGLIAVLFGPLAPLLAPYVTIPTINLLEAPAWASEPLWQDNDLELYQWTRENTEPDTLFFWCDFGPITTLNFRRQTERSITHNWKQLNVLTFNMSVFVPSMERYRRLEGGCQNIGTAGQYGHRAGGRLYSGLNGRCRRF